MKNTNERVTYISILQVVGPILVIIGHMTNGLPMTEAQKIIKSFIYAFHMQLFFFISGYLFAYKNGIKKGEYFEFIKKKFWRLMFPYIVLNLAFFIPKVIFSSYLADSAEFSIVYFLKIMITPKLNIWGHTWFLFALFIMYILSPLWNLILKKNSKAILVLSIAISCIIYNLPIKTMIFAINDLCRNILFFIVGMLIFKIPTGIIKNNINKVKYICLLIFVLVLFVFYYKNNNKLIQMILCTSQILTLFITSIIFYKRNDKIEYLAQKSFSIYILHWPFMLVTQIVLYKILFINSLIVSIIMCISGFIMPLTFIKIIELIKKRFNIKSKLLYYLIGI